MSKSVAKLATIGEVAQLLNVPLHRVAYVLRTRPHIVAGATAGITRCFDDHAIAQIRNELICIAARRGKGQQ